MSYQGGIGCVGNHGNYQQGQRSFVPQHGQGCHDASSMGQEDKHLVLIERVLEVQNEVHKANVEKQDEFQKQLKAMNSKVEDANGDLHSMIGKLNSYVKSLEGRIAQMESSQEASTQTIQGKGDITTQMLQRILDSQRKCEIEDYARQEELKNHFLFVNDNIDEIYGELKGEIRKLGDHVKDHDKKMECSSNEFCGAILPNGKNGVKEGTLKEDKVRIQETNEMSNGKRHSQEGLAKGKNDENKVQVEEILAIHTFGETPKSYPIKLEKVEDLGQFTIPCVVNGIELEHTLVDSGASVNVISRESAMKFGMKEVSPYHTTITLADSSSTKPQGLIKNYPLLVNGCEVPTDLVVVENVQKGEMPLILGRPFLTTVGAQIDFPNKRVFLKYLGNKSYPLIPSLIPFCGTLISEKKEAQESLKIEECGSQREGKASERKFKEISLEDSKTLLAKEKNVGKAPSCGLASIQLVFDERNGLEKKKVEVNDDNAHEDAFALDGESLDHLFSNPSDKKIASHPKALKKKEQDEDDTSGYVNEEAFSLDGDSLYSLFSTTMENEIEQSMEEPTKAKKQATLLHIKDEPAPTKETSSGEDIHLALFAIGPRKGK